MSVSSPEKWGPDAWRKFHIKALTYPTNPRSCDIEKVERFYQVDFFRYIECNTCASHYRRLLREHPIDARSMYSLFKWTVDIHNRINARLHRPQISYYHAFNNWIMIINHSYPGRAFFCQTIANPYGGRPMPSSIGPIPATYFMGY